MLSTIFKSHSAIECPILAYGFCITSKKSISQHILLAKLFKTITFEQNCTKDGYEWTIE